MSEISEQIASQMLSEAFPILNDSGIIHRGEYNPTTQYIKNNVVTLLGSSYMCTIPGVGIVPTNPSNWQLLASKGDRGVVFQWRDTYSTSTTYEINDAVVDASKRNIYISLVTNNTNNPLTDATKWEILMTVGDLVASVNNAVDISNTTNTNITNAEDTRVAAENSRVSVESSREVAENNRVSAENSRVSVENSREVAEATRESNETTRQNQETDRQTNTTNAINSVNLVRDSYNYDSNPYDNVKAYVVNNQVSYNGSSFICIQNSVGNLPTDNAFWRVFAAAGSVGSVDSANSDIGVSNPTSSPILTLNSGVGANKIVKRNGSGGIDDVVAVDDKIGLLSGLTTVQKASLVGAINELDSDVGDKSTLATSSKTNTVAAINEIAAAYPINAMSRQAIINGNFDVWQRGTSVTNPNNGIYTADRFRASWNLNGGTAPANILHLKRTLLSGDIPGAYFFYRISPDGAGSAFGAAAYYEIEQRIEHGVRNLCGLGKKVTVSFWAKSSIPNKKLGLYLAQRYGSGGVPTATESIQGTNWTLTANWAKYSFTFTTLTLVGKSFGTNDDDSLNAFFSVMWGSGAEATSVGATGTETFGGAGNIDIAQVQVCAGDVALPFQPRSFAEELALCQRYFRIVGYGAIGEWVSATEAQVFGQFDTPMRIAPTITLNKTNPLFIEVGVNARTGTGSTFNGTATDPHGYFAAVIGFTGATAGKTAAVRDDCFNFDAEL